MMKKFCLALAGALLLSTVNAVFADTTQSSSLRAKFASLGDALRHNDYKRPLYIESAEGSSTVNGDVYALLDYPFSTVGTALTGPGPWCDIMIMPVNTKGCRVTARPGATGLTVRIGRKSDQPIEDAYPIEFNYRVAATSPDYFAVRLDAESGPLGTHDYRVLVEASPGEDGKTLLHLHYSYGYGLGGRLAVQAYLATAGADKVGFSSSGGKLIGGMRGIVERNTMRYYLAIDAYLSAAAAPSGQRVDRRLATWFDATEQYARQLHEIERPEYLAMKRREVQRQQTALGSVSASDSAGRL